MFARSVISLMPLKIINRILKTLVGYNEPAEFVNSLSDNGYELKFHYYCFTCQVENEHLLITGFPLT